MKKFNYNIIIFIISALLIVGGWFSKDLLIGIKNALVSFIETPNIEAFIDNVETASKDIRYKGTLIDLYSLYYRITDTRIVEKADETVIRMENDYLAFSKSAVDMDTCEELAERTAELKVVTDDLDIPLLYAMVPAKLYFGETTDNTANAARQSYNDFASALDAQNINVLNLAEKMDEQGLSMEDAYFITDHHWIPETGFWAFREICKKMKEDYNFSYDEKLLDLNNYNVDVYEDWFLGSVGKKVGKYFSPLGLDDISLITPNFETELEVTDDRGTLNGTFADTVIDMSHLSTKSYYKANPYAAYSSGDFGLQLIHNKSAAEGAKEIIVIRDSFACTVTPFLSLATDSLHILDVRYWEGTAEADTITEYIRTVKPDYVIMLYSLISPEMFNF